jgi:TonB family protein
MILAMSVAAALAAQSGEASAPQRARSSLNQYFSSDDYPETALARGAEGTVGFRLDIGADGMVTRCRVTQSSNDEALDAATCAIILGRVRYQPARDASGRAIAGKDEGRVTWRLPPPAPGLPFTRLRMVSQLRWSGAGELSCTVTVNGAPEADVSPNRCGGLDGTGIGHALRQMGTAAAVTHVSVSGPADAGLDSVGADEAGYGAMQFDVVADFTVGRDGRIGPCRMVRRNVPPASLATVPDLCAPLPAEIPPIYAPTTDPAPRNARFRQALYFREGPAPQAHPPPAPATPSP